MEDHDGAYWAWKSAGLKDRVLFHFDAHLDFSWISPSASSLLEEKDLSSLLDKAAQSPLWDMSGKSADERVHLGNFIHEAVKNGIVREFLWVYPDDPDTARQDEAVRCALKSTARLCPREFRIGERGNEGEFQGTIYGRPFRAIPFSSLARFVPGEDVLLDVDVDFFVVRSLHDRHYPIQDPMKPSWWLAPKDFVAALNEAGLRHGFATLSYSVEEGYTPLALKFLGDELAARLEGDLTPEREARYEALRSVHSQAADLCLRDKIERLERALDSHRTADVLFNLAISLTRAGEIERGKALYAEAIARDPSYRTQYNHPGPALWEAGLRREAEASYDLMSRLDPAHPAYRLFRFELLLADGRWEPAAALGAQIASDGCRGTELLLGLAQCDIERRRFGEALNWLSRCDGGVLKPAALREYWLFRALAAEGLKRRDEALEAYHNLVRCSVRQPRAHLALAKLYLRRGNLYKARRHAWKAYRQRERAG